MVVYYNNLVHSVNYDERGVYLHKARLHKEKQQQKPHTFHIQTRAF